MEKSGRSTLTEAVLEKYEMLEERKVEGLHSQGWYLRHKKSGARVLILSNDDENKVFYIGFRTPPKDSTGVPHILEHSVLCGSRKFPVSRRLPAWLQTAAFFPLTLWCWLSAYVLPLLFWKAPALQWKRAPL